MPTNTNLMTRLQQDLQSLINSENREEDSNTPDFILAEYMIRCLEAFEIASNRREVWYGAELGSEKKNIS